ncbi:MAG: DUF7144 family membrane protein [Solirubrobacterales bacterium]
MTQNKGNYATGWIGFSGTLLAIAGVLNLIDGIASLAKADQFDVAQYLFGDLTTWGIIYLILGALQIYAAALLFKSHASGMIMAVTFAAIGGIAHFLSIGAYPIWSVTVMILCFVVMFGLLTHSDAFD